MALTTPVKEIIERSKSPLLSIKPGWRRVQLSDIATVLNGFAFRSELFSSTDGVPLIRIRDVVRGHTETNFRGDYDKRYLVAPGDLLIGMDGDFNCARWRGPTGLLNQRVCKVTVRSEDYRLKFLDYVLPGYLKAVNDATSSVTVKHLSSRTVEALLLPLPSLREQDEIVAEIEKQFSRLDEAVASLERAKANLARYKAAILKAAVEGRLVPTEASLSHLSGQPFESGADLVKRLRAKALGSEGSSKRPTSFDQSAVSSECAPEGWQQTPLCSVAEVQLGQQRAPVHAAAEEQIPYIRAANITWQGIDLSDVKAMGFQNLARYRLEYGDVLLSEASGSASEVGKPAIWRDQIPGACYQKTVLRVRSRDHEAVSPEFLHLTFLNACLSGAFRRLAPGVGILHLTAERMIEWPLLLPPGAEQRRIVAEVDRLMSIARATEAQLDTALARAARLRQSILSRAFSGSGEATG